MNVLRNHWPRLLAALLLAAAPSQAASLYANTSLDLFQSIIFSDQGWEELGDQITLNGAAPVLNSATLQLFNRGVAGTFDATLRFYAVGAPVGAELGSFTLSGLNAVESTGPSLGVFTIDFALLGLMVPQELIFTLQTSSATAGVDLGLNLFGPPTAGASDDAFFIGREQNFETVAGLPGNFYLSLDGADSASAVPEPGSGALVLVTLALFTKLTRLRRN